MCNSLVFTDKLRRHIKLEPALYRISLPYQNILWIFAHAEIRDTSLVDR